MASRLIIWPAGQFEDYEGFVEPIEVVAAIVIMRCFLLIHGSGQFYDLE